MFGQKCYFLTTINFSISTILDIFGIIPGRHEILRINESYLRSSLCKISQIQVTYFSHSGTICFVLYRNYGGVYYGHCIISHVILRSRVNSLKFHGLTSCIHYANSISIFVFWFGGLLISVLKFCFRFRYWSWFRQSMDSVSVSIPGLVLFRP